MGEFPLITDHTPLLQSRGMFDGGTDASMFAAVADGYASVTDYNTVSGEEEQMNKGTDLFFCDLPELCGFDDSATNTRNFNPTFEIDSSYFDDTLWSSIYSPVAQLVPNSCFGSTNVSGVSNPSATTTLTGSSVSVPDQINMTHFTNIQQQTRNDGSDHAPSSNEAHAIPCSDGEIDQLSQYIDAELFAPFDDTIAGAERTGGCEGLEAVIRSNPEMQVPRTSSTMLPPVPDESVVTSSSACSGAPDLVTTADIPCYKRKLGDPLHGTPDMLLEGMAENPLEMYFPPLTTFEQPEILLTSDTSTQTYEEFAGGTGAANCAGVQFCSKDMSSAAELRTQLPSTSTLILEAVPVKDLGFHRLQNVMNQMDVATKRRIRDALYRLANTVELRHHVARRSGLAVGASSSSRRLGSGGWTTETQTNPVDQSVARLLLQKPPYRNTVIPTRVA